MKRLGLLLLSMVLALSFAVPSMAAATNAVTTAVLIGGGAGDPPVVKCKWEWPDDADPAYPGYTTTSIPGTQIMPPVSYQGTKPVEFYAVVTDSSGVNTVRDVWADVWHPLGAPENGSFKFQVQLAKHYDGSTPDLFVSLALAKFDTAVQAGVIKFNTGFTAAEVREELIQGDAQLFEGAYVMSYHQPYGTYKVIVTAFDSSNNQGTLENHFLYYGVTATEFDFIAIDYGTVQVQTDVLRGGDTVFSQGDGKPTVRNIGNTWAKIWLFQDDMGFGQTVGQVPPWNVLFDARLGDALTGTLIHFDPAFAKGATPTPNGPKTVLPDILKLCNTQKLDFSILVKKALLSSYSGNMWIGAQFEQFNPAPTPYTVP